MSILDVKSLGKNYPGFSLRDVSFSLVPGAITGFIGKNGAGKTTTLKSLLNLVHPDSGDIQIFGLPFKGNERVIKPRIGFVSGGIRYYPGKKLKTIADVTSSFFPQWNAAAYRSYLERFKLDEGKTPAQLSEGMKLKFSIALALSHEAELLVLDEPTSGLDPISRDELLEIFLELRDGGTTILFSTHITTDLERCASRILYLSAGQLKADTDLNSFISRYRLLPAIPENLPPGAESAFVGRRRTRDGHSALLTPEDAERLGLPVQRADLESIMVHLERETES